MRRAFLGLGVWTACCVVSWAACESDGIHVVPGRDVFVPNVVDFGESQIGVTHEQQVVMTLPRSLGAVRVVDVRFAPETGTFAVHLSDGSSLRGAEFDEGASVVIVVAFLPREAGEFSAVLRIAFQDNRAVELAVKGRGSTQADAPLVFSPTELRFSRAEVGRSHHQLLAIENRQPVPVDVRDVWLNNSGGRPRRGVDAFSATDASTHEDLGPFRLAGRTTRTFDVEFAPTATGTTADAFVFSIATADGQRTLHVPLFGVAYPSGELVVSPSSVSFGAIRRGMRAEKEISLRSIGGVFTLSTVRLVPGSSDAFSLVAVPQDGAILDEETTAVVRVAFVARGLASNHAGQIVIGAPPRADRIVRLDATVEAPPRSEHDLSVVLVWDRDDVDLDLHAVRTPGEPFSVDDDCYYRNKNPDWGVAGSTDDDPYLDRDDRTQGGPEEVNLLRAGGGSVAVHVHFFSGDSMSTTATVTVLNRGDVLASRARTLASCGAFWHVGTASYLASAPAWSLADNVTDRRAFGTCP